MLSSNRTGNKYSSAQTKFRSLAVKATEVFSRYWRHGCGRNAPMGQFTESFDTQFGAGIRCAARGILNYLRSRRISKFCSVRCGLPDHRFSIKGRLTMTQTKCVHYPYCQCCSIAYRMAPVTGIQCSSLSAAENGARNTRDSKLLPEKLDP